MCCVDKTERNRNTASASEILFSLPENYPLYSRIHKQNAKLVLIINSISSSQRFNGIQAFVYVCIAECHDYNTFSSINIQNTDTRNDCRDEKISC